MVLQVACTQTSAGRTGAAFLQTPFCGWYSLFTNSILTVSVIKTSLNACSTYRTNTSLLSNRRWRQRQKKACIVLLLCWRKSLQFKNPKPPEPGIRRMSNIFDYDDIRGTVEKHLGKRQSRLGSDRHRVL